MKRYVIIALIAMCNTTLNAQAVVTPDTVTVLSDGLRLKGLLWHPVGEGAFPAIIFCHGSYATSDNRYDAVQQCSILGNIFVERGYVFLAVFRRGTALSSKQGENSADLMEIAMKQKGQQERNKVQLHQLLTSDSKDIHAGINYLLRRKDVDKKHLAILGHSYGGSLALLVAEDAPVLKAVVVFGAAGYSWNLNPELRTALINAARKIKVPLMIVHAQNDYSVTPGKTLDSVFNSMGKSHLLKIYPSYGQTETEGHNILFLDSNRWETDVFEFLHQNLH